jgi:predicted transcriptional regulator of viral defense system
MKYYEKLLGMGIFSFADLIKLTGNKDTANSLTGKYQEKQYIIRIKRNLYTAVNLETKEAVVGKFEIGSNVTDTSYVSHHSAFEYHGVMNQVYYEVYVSSESKFKNFEFGVCQGSCRIFFNCFSQSSVHPHLFHGSLDNEPLIACV